MAAGIELHPKELAGCPFKCVVGRIGVGPLDQHAFVEDRVRCCDRRRGGIAAQVQSGDAPVGWRIGNRQAGILHVHGVELAVAAIVRVEVEAVQPVSVARRDEEPREDARVAVAAVKIQICRELFRRFIKDVERPVQVGNEKPIRASRLLADRVHPGQQHFVGALTLRHARHGHGDVILQFDGQLRRGIGGPKSGEQRQREGGAPFNKSHGLILDWRQSTWPHFCSAHRGGD